MLVQIGALGEGELTTGLLALERSLPCMNSQVIKEVMPLFESFKAFLMGAQKLLHNSFAFRIF
jgi:hypothetical protein